MYVAVQQTALLSSCPTFFSVFSALRVYAIWNVSRWKYGAAGIVFTIGMVPVAVILVRIIFGSFHTSCHSQNTKFLLIQTTYEYIGPLSTCIATVIFPNSLFSRHVEDRSTVWPMLIFCNVAVCFRNNLYSYSEFAYGMCSNSLIKRKRHSSR